MNKQLDEILRLKDAAHYIGVSEVTLWRMNKSDDTFPKKIYMSPRCAGYKKSEIDDWLESKKS